MPRENVISTVWIVIYFSATFRGYQIIRVSCYYHNLKKVSSNYLSYIKIRGLK